MSNTIGNANTAKPLLIKTLAGFAKGPAIVTEEELATLRAFSAKEKEHSRRKAELNPPEVREAVEQQFKAFGRGQGPLPTQTPQLATEIAELARKRLRTEFDQWYEGEARRFFAELFPRLITRCRAGLAALEEKAKKEADGFGTPYEKPPFVWSGERTIESLERRLKHIKENGSPDFFQISELIENLS